MCESQRRSPPLKSTYNKHQEHTKQTTPIEHLNQMNKRRDHIHTQFNERSRGADPIDSTWKILSFQKQHGRRTPTRPPPPPNAPHSAGGGIREDLRKQKTERLLRLFRVTTTATTTATTTTTTTAATTTATATC